MLIHAGTGIYKEDLKKYKNMNLEFPSRKILAVVEIEDCLELDEKLNRKIINEKNIAYGSKYRTGYAWKLKNVKKIKSDEVINGKLGLWNVDIK